FDEEGHRVASGEVSFFANAREQRREGEVVLSFRMMPSFTWRQSGILSGQSGTDSRTAADIGAEAALPAYHLLIMPRNMSDQNRAQLSQIPLKFKYRMSLESQK
ncbi:MAG TPA: hypothetical protein VN260_02975, partial [Dissulfurispiraceae bacterium]|nr:hypothetical protein [Dissulfurispiraceae bacterium]